MSNRIHNLDTKLAQGSVPILVVGLDLDDLDGIEPFMMEVVEAIKLQRMRSPPETATLLISIIGLISTEEFKELWLQAAARDQILSFFMSRMDKAMVIRGQPDGTFLEEASLLPVTDANPN